MIFFLTSVSEELKNLKLNSLRNSCCLREASFRNFRIWFWILAVESEVLIFGSFHQDKPNAVVISLLFNNFEYKKLKNYIYNILEKAVGKRQRSGWYKISCRTISPYCLFSGNRIECCLQRENSYHTGSQGNKFPIQLKM